MSKIIIRPLLLTKMQNNKDWFISYLKQQKNWTKHGTMALKTLDIKKHRTVIPWKRGNTWGRPCDYPSWLPWGASKLLCRGVSLEEPGGLLELRWSRETRELKTARIHRTRVLERRELQESKLQGSAEGSLKVFSRVLINTCLRRNNLRLGKEMYQSLL